MSAIRRVIELEEELENTLYSVLKNDVEEILKSDFDNRKIKDWDMLTDRLQEGFNNYKEMILIAVLEEYFNDEENEETKD